MLSMPINVKSVITTLQSFRNNSVAEFSKVYTEALKLGKSFNGEGYELSKPRTADRQMNRSNPSISSPEDYFRVTLYNEFLDHLVAELHSRFLDSSVHDIILGLLHLLPTECINENSVPKELAEAVFQKFENDLPHPMMMETEYSLWKAKWKQESLHPKKLVDTFLACSLFQFPNIHTLLRIALTLPITSCESERSFSQLQLVKTSCRSTMSDARLSGLSQFLS